MKKIIYFAVAMAMLFSYATCEAAKPKKKNKNVVEQPQPKSPFGATFKIPNAEVDTDEYFGASGIATGPKIRMAEIYATALTNAQNIVRQKMAHAYKGAIDDYMNMVGDNVGNDYQTKLERGGTQIIDAIVNDTRETKEPVFSEVDEKGNITCYLGIRVYKNQIAEKIADYVAEEDELKIRFKEDQFRQRMEENFKKFKEN